MIFINPKIDFAFKKIFGSEDSKDILISFLNALIYEAQPVIHDLEILNPYLAPKIRGVKDTYLDIKAKIIDSETSEERTVIIEMQVLNVEGFEKRILYNAAKSYSIQLTTGQGYNLLNPVIALTITDFVMFTDLPNVTSRFVLKEKDFLIDYPIYDIELIFVELPKFKKNLTELETIIDKWLFFLNNARKLQNVPSTIDLIGNKTAKMPSNSYAVSILSISWVFLKTLCSKAFTYFRLSLMDSIPELKKAFYIANQANLNLDELKEQEKSEIFIQDQRGAITKAARESLEQGRQEGRQEGLAEGLRQKAYEIARKMLGVLDDQAIAQMTGLTLDEIRSIQS
ncbi:Rpn family recombination-promoting nuclease/putative transposase [Pseudanabaena sp. UWO311]|uniref:Rpn family recombination-promoting nuclease/putative transposase n=1 Tax=Pseudanabaena sp. UWO311 TaxID=2487337 RepID=UPI00115B4642|nr:Rpn family recombination-promoting nuclease/putative transposase [Pseudanabaena sp. UWO311]TYQ23356.1 Rpn family recombination-promoting nuclease/putative transposase [Pseudanabaena sp. UWO311]